MIKGAELKDDDHDQSSTFGDPENILNPQQRGIKDHYNLPVAVLGIFVKGCCIYNCEYGAFLIRVTVQKLQSKTCLAPVRLNTQVEWNELKHVPVTIYPENSDPRNNIQICLMSHLGFEEHKYNIIGSAFLHLHNILKSKCMSVLVDLTTLQEGRGSLVIGELELEVCMSYGMFGFGDSHQLVFKDCVPESYLHHSLFPRIEATVAERTDTNGLLLPKHMPHPSFIPFQTTAFLANSLISDERCESTGRVSRLQRTMTRLPVLRRKLNNISCRHERLTFLKKIITESAEETTPVAVTPLSSRKSLTSSDGADFTVIQVQGNLTTSMKNTASSMNSATTLSDSVMFGPNKLSSSNNSLPSVAQPGERLAALSLCPIQRLPMKSQDRNPPQASSLLLTSYSMPPTRSLSGHHLTAGLMSTSSCHGITAVSTPCSDNEEISSI